MFEHEQAYRGESALRKRAEFPLTICGAGAIGSLLAETLARQGFARISVIDFDRVERHNLATQAYAEGDVGVLKVKALQNRIHRDLGIRIETSNRRIDPRTVKDLAGAALVVDAFDNGASRRVVQEYCAAKGIPCVHAGLSPDGFAEIRWNEAYKSPADAPAPVDPCEVPLARNLIALTVAALGEVVARFADSGVRLAREATLGDLAVYDPEAG